MDHGIEVEGIIGDDAACNYYETHGYIVLQIKQLL